MVLKQIRRNARQARRRIAFTKLTSGCLLLGVVVATGSATMCRADKAPFVRDASFPESHVQAEEAILRKLHKTYPAFLAPTTLNGIVTSLKSIDISARLDVLALEDLGITSDEHVDWHGSPVSLVASLEQSLYEFDLTWIIRGGALLITTQDNAEQQMRTKIYRVSGIVEFRQIPLWGGNARQAAWQDRYDFDTLIENISIAVEPDTWEYLGGSATITAHATVRHQFLIVSQTDRVHDMVEIYLWRLNQLGGARQPRSVSPSTTLTQSSKLPEVGRDNSSRRSLRLPGSF